MDHNPTGDSGTGPAPADNSETEDFSELGEFADDNLVDELGSHVSNPGSWTCPKDAELTISPATLHQPVTQLSLRGEGRIGSCIISLLRAAMLSIGENRPVGDIWDFIAFNSLRHHPAEFFRSTLSEGFESLRQIKSSLGGNPDPWQRKLLRRTYKERQRLLVNDSWICIGPLVREFKPLMVVDLLKALLKIESADIAGAIFFKLVTDARATYGADSPFSKLIKMFHDVFLEENLAGLHTVVRRVFASVPDIACKLLGRTSLIAHFLIALTEARTADGRDVASLLEDMREPIVSTKDDLKTIRRKLTVLYFVAGNFKKTLGATDDRVLKETAAAAQAAELLRERMEQQDGDTPRLAHYYLRGTYKLWADALHDRAIAAADAGVASSASSPASYYTAASTVPNDSLDAARARLLLGNPLFRLATVYLEKSLTHHVVLTSGKDPETLRLRARLRDWYTQLGDFRAADGLRECAVVA